MLDPVFSLCEILPHFLELIFRRVLFLAYILANQVEPVLEKLAGAVVLKLLVNGHVSHILSRNVQEEESQSQRGHTADGQEKKDVVVETQISHEEQRHFHKASAMQIVFRCDVAELDNGNFENNDELDRAEEGVVEDEPREVFDVVLTDAAANPVQLTMDSGGQSD